ncbi:MAG: PPOX class F420-dependent oxidoreductase [Actinobacteria bacterium]|nr:PPOX class F420-dependent oxidoreductase [Actinomycetota bacterium]
MAQKLSEAAKDLLGQKVIANVATISPSGKPQITPVWVDVDGDDILINTAEGRAKAVNLRRNPNVAISVVDPADPYRAVVLRGTVVEIQDGPEADNHIDRLAQKYLGQPTYPMRQPGERRLKMRVRTEKIVSQP